jgi:hypothetical protein
VIAVTDFRDRVHMGRTHATYLCVRKPCFTRPDTLAYITKTIAQFIPIPDLAYCVIAIAFNAALLRINNVDPLD